MKYDKSFLRKKFLLKRKKNFLLAKKFNFNLLFSIINKHFLKKKVVIAGYYPSNYEVNILEFLEKALKKNFKVALPVIKSSSSMCFKSWTYKEPLSMNSFGIPEPHKIKKEIIPDIILVPLVAFDGFLNRIGYGKGYYDRSLSKIKIKNKNMITLGIAYSFQKSSKIPINKFDIKLDYILTEQEIISSNK